MIRDQRHMFTGVDIATVADVRAVWEQVAQARGITLYDTADSVVAYVSHGRWVADCPNPDCSPDGRGSEAAWPEHDRWACLTCGVVCDVEFPDAETIEAADVILAARPEVSTRNWYPATESLGRLQVESILLDGVPADFAGIVIDGRRLGANELTDQFAQAMLERRQYEFERGLPALGAG